MFTVIFHSLKGVVNSIFYSFLLYFIESKKLGIDVITSLFKAQAMTKRNDDIIINEDSDVSDERSKVMNSIVNVNTINSVFLNQDLKK